jgi:tetratricopeptide (TPR) repeat protein
MQNIQLFTKINMMRFTLLSIFMATIMFSYSQNSFATITVSAIPDSAEYFYQKGLLEKQNGRKLESMKNFEKALRYDEKSKVILAELAASYHDLNKYSQARDAYKKLVLLGDEVAFNYRKLMTLSFQLKQNNDVLLYADKLKAMDPKEKVYYYVGKVNYELENYGEAIKLLNEAVKEDPTNAEVPYMLAHCYADMMNYKLAAPYFKKAIELDPKQPYWYYELGLICYAMHADKDALKYILEAAEKGYKKDNDYLENLGIAYLNVGNYQQGLEMLTEILKRKPGDMNILNMVAETYYSTGDFTQAMNYWDKMLEYDKENAASLYMIGMCYQKKGGKENKEKGIQLCDKAIAMDPSLSSYKQKKLMAGL